MTHARIKILFLIVGVFLVACSRSPNKPTMEYMPNMMDSPAIKAQELAMRLPPEGTKPINFETYPFTINEGNKAASLENPFPITKQVLTKGGRLYNTYCIVCHGSTGQGNGTMVPRFPRPPSLHSDKVRTWSDGQIYHVVTMGQNLMPSYASQIFPEERWEIIRYVRALQRSVNPTTEDIELFEEVSKKNP